MEYFVKEKMTSISLGEQKEFVHFGLTSQDINNTAIPLALKEAIHKVYIPTLTDLISTLTKVKQRGYIYIYIVYPSSICHPYSFILFEDILLSFQLILLFDI